MRRLLGVAAAPRAGAAARPTAAGAPRRPPARRAASGLAGAVGVPPLGGPVAAAPLGGVRCGSWLRVETPNPRVLKFEHQATSASSSGPPRRAAGAAGLPGARGRLLGLEGVRDVFVAGAVADGGAPWVSVTRAEGACWEALSPRVLEVLDALPAASEEPAEEATQQSGVEAESGAAAPGGRHALMEQIEEVLEHRVRPGVRADGGDVELAGFDAEAGQVTVRLRGACRGCPQSAVTLRDSISRALCFYVPEVRSVVAAPDEELEDSSDPCADISWRHDGEFAAPRIAALAAGGTPFFSTFAGTKVEGRLLKRVRFLSEVQLAGRTPEHIIVSCDSCKAKRSIEDPNDLLRADKGNVTGNAAVVICPTCCVLVTA